MNKKCGVKLKVDISDDVRDAAIQMYVEQNLTKESISTYHDYIEDGDVPIGALAHAVINEMVIRALMDEIARKEFEEYIKEE